MDKTKTIENFPQLQVELTKNLSRLAQSIENIMATIGENDISILSEVQKVSEDLLELESTASTYFLHSLLSEYTCFTQEISRTIRKLSLKGHGALIVIEKNDPVSPHLTGGTPLHARVSSQLLESIFNPESQIHSGAVLIQSDSIVSASNVLPTSQVVYWNRVFDVRELAAVGLSERCDALVLVVTDSGSTTFSIGGNLYPFSAS